MGTSREVGDRFFPLEVTPAEIVTSHALVGRRVLVNSHATETLHAHRGKQATVIGVVLKSGQLAGLRVKIESKSYVAPIASFFVEAKYSEDIYTNTDYAQYIIQKLSHWQRQRSYRAETWHGLEALHFELATAARQVAVESRGGYSYGFGMQDWRLIVFHNDETVAINCHSLAHERVWTLNTTIFSTREVDLARLEFVGSNDHWERALLWTRAVVQALHGPSAPTLDELDARLLAGRQAMNRARQILPHVQTAYRALGHEPDTTTKFSIGFSKVRLDPFSIGHHESPTDERPYSVLTIDPDALENPEYLLAVLWHELIHFARKEPCGSDAHGPVFQQVAERVGLPKAYRD